LTYQVQGRQVNSNERYQVQGPVDTSTNDQGQFRLPWADNYLPGTLEVFVQITSPGLQPVELQYLLGTTTHQVALVMRSSAFRQLLAARIGLYGALVSTQL